MLLTGDATLVKEGRAVCHKRVATNYGEGGGQVKFTPTTRWGWAAQVLRYRKTGEGVCFQPQSKGAAYKRQGSHGDGKTGKMIMVREKSGNKQK